MLFKLVGSILIVAATTFIGYVYAKDCRKRPVELRAMQGMLKMMESQISYLSSILSDTFENIYRNSNSKPAIFFHSTVEKLNDGSMPNASDAWCEAVTENVKNTSLNKEDMDVLLTFGKLLGNTDLEGQIKNIGFAVEQLKIQEIKAEENRKKNEVLYRNLGFLSGVVIVIMLI